MVGVLKIISKGHSLRKPERAFRGMFRSRFFTLNSKLKRPLIISDNMCGLYNIAMKNLRVRIISLCLISLGCLNTAAQTPDAPTGLEKGVCAFATKDYPLAETEFEKALQQAPANRLLILFTARAIDFQVDPKDRRAGNLEKARTAIDAYSKLLEADPSNIEASSSIVRLYAQIDPAKLPEIAANEATPKSFSVHWP
jgi:tetratricopeptide (TPR) repeat protein